MEPHHATLPGGIVRMKCLLRLLAFFVLAQSSFAQGITYLRIGRPLIEAQLKLSTDGPKERVRALRKQFEKAGCPQLIEQAVPKEDVPNLICVLPGREEGTIVIGASLDYLPEDSSTPARWGALAMLPLMTESLNLVPHQFTLMFVAFSGREHGLRGSNWYVEQLPEPQRQTIWAMVDLDALGKTPPVYTLGQADKALATWMQVAAHSLRLPSPPPVDPTTIDRRLQNGVSTVRTDDLWVNAKPFVEKGVPAITVQSATPEMLPALRRQGAISEEVKGIGFDLDAYENTYRLLCVYALYLDRNLGPPRLEPGLYTGKIIDAASVLGRGGQVDVAVQIDRFTTRAELSRYEAILKKSGQVALAEALSTETKGTYRFGMNLAFGARAIVAQRAGDRPSVLILGTRMKRQASTGLEYQFVAIKLIPDRQGMGSGQFCDMVRLRFNRNHEPEVDDCGHVPDEILQVRLDSPRTAAKVEVAGAAMPQGAESSSARSSTASAATPSNSQAPTGSSSQTATAAASGATGATPASTTASTPPAATSEPSAATFKTKAQLVQLDVVATDAQGKPVLGLQQSDFTVLEDGVPQQVGVFEPHAPGIRNAESAPAPDIKLPPNTFTNRVTAPPVEGTLNILLLDVWNTPVTDQAYARKQAIEFLKTLPKGKPLAIFVLGSKLSMVQGFTDDSSTLVAAAEKVLNERSTLLTTEAERQSQQGFTDSIARNALPGLAATGAPAEAIKALQTGGGVDVGSAQARTRSEAVTEAERTAQRVSVTLAAFLATARSVSSYPGRKNLVWLSGSFPVTLKPTAADFNRISIGSTSSAPGQAVRENFLEAIRAVATALAAARIAVYPVDVRGIQTSGVDLSLGAAESGTFAGTGEPTQFGRNLNSQSEARFSDRSSMKEVAEQTGGEVIAGNDVRGAIGRALDDGSTYYALAYVPAKDNLSKEFRKIEVKTNRPGLKLAYRPGYFPNSALDTASAKANPLIVALQPGVPDATVIPLTVEVLPPDDRAKKTRITSTIDIHGLEFAETVDHRHRGVLDCVAVAFSLEGVPVAQASNRVDVTLPAGEYETIVQNGLTVRQEIELAPGRYALRLGVMDRGTQAIGTLTIPVTIPAK